MAEQTSTSQSSAPALEKDAKANPKAEAKASKAAPAPAGDARTGMSFWNTATFITAGASDLVKPVADFAVFFLIAFAIGTAGAAYLTFVRKPPLPFARTFLGTLGLGTAVFGFLVLARFATPEGIGQERGVIAAFVPPVAAAQTAVLPLSPVEKELLTLSSSLSSGDPEARSAAARTAISDPKEDKALRRAKLERVLNNSDPNIQQAGIVQALADRGRSPLSIIPDDKAPEGPLKTFLIGAQFGFFAVSVETGGFNGVFAAGGANQRMSGTVANGRLILNAPYARERWKDGLVMDLHIGDQFKLVGTVRTPEDPPIVVEVPLL
jgi:hypothetical protein